MAEKQNNSGLANPLVVHNKPKAEKVQNSIGSAASANSATATSNQSQKVFTPLPQEPAAPVKNSSAQPVSGPKPKVAPLPDNSAEIATAAGFTSAQIEKQSGQKTFPKGKPVAPKTPAAPPKVPTQKSAAAPKQNSNPSVATKASQPNFVTKLLAGFAKKPAKPDPAAVAKNPNEQKVVQDDTAAQQFVNHNQVATSGFIDKIFGRNKKPANTTSAAAPTVADQQGTSAELARAEKIYQEGLASVRDLISPSSFEAHYDHLNLSGVFARSFFVYAYPRFLDTNWMSPIINFDATVDIAQFIYPIASTEIMRTLKKKVAQIQSSITMATEKGNVRDPQLETALEDAEQLRTDLQRGQEKFFQFGMYFTVYAEDLKKLEATTKIIENQLGGKLILTKRADIQGEHAFNSTLPLALDELEVQRNMNTSPLSTTFPFISSSLATDEGILYGLNRHNNSLIIFDRFKLPNANSTVFATSGAGKSYAVKLEILRQVMLGTDVIVVDPENEYKALTETVGGSYLNVSLNSDQRINPFDLPQPFEGDDVKPGDLLRENIITLTGLLKLMLGEMTSEEAALIDKALIDTYAVRGVTMSVEDPSKMPMPTMEDFHAVLKSMQGAESLAQRLQKFTSGTFGGIFNRETNVNLGDGLIVFCIRDLEEELRPIAMFILLNFIWSRVRSKLKKRILVVDEAWTMMQHEDAAKFLFGLVKRARKYYLGVVTITQDVEDFLESRYGRPMVTNASMQILLKQAPKAVDALKKTFNLTDGEKYMLLNSGVGQGLFFADNKHVAIQVIASYSENQIVTTNPEELLAQREEGFQ
ncbi:MAG: ATP-binding protein [Candidatus Peribacteraceae bacterium]|nr:ATP-binding protein [Candidatus Peribacteraceae bacterium]